MMKTKILSLALATICFVGYSQTNSPSGSFYDSAVGYFTSFNTNLDSTFASEKGEVWTGVDSIQGGIVPLANSLHIDYHLYKGISVESVTRNSGVAGTLVSEQIGLGLGFVVHDSKLTVYGDAGYQFAGSGIKSIDRLYGEFGARVQKALSEHTFGGTGIGVQLPKSSQVFTVFAGFTF